MPMDALVNASHISLILANCWAIGAESFNFTCVSCLHRLKAVVLLEAPPYVSFSLSHLSLNVGRLVFEVISEYTSVLMYMHRYALDLFWTNSHSIVGMFLGGVVYWSMSLASRSVRITSM